MQGIFFILLPYSQKPTYSKVYINDSVYYFQFTFLPLWNIFCQSAMCNNIIHMHVGGMGGGAPIGTERGLGSQPLFITILHYKSTNSH